MLRDPDLAFQPNKFASAHHLEQAGDVLHVRGYQDFTFDPRSGDLHPCTDQLGAKEAVLDRVLVPRYMARRSILDLGGNNGFFALRALKAGATAAAVVDIDPNCVRNIEELRSHRPGLELRACLQNLEDWREPADGVFALALVHWIYSCTARLLSLERVVELLASLARDFLVVEWVDPEDPVVKSFHHTEVDGDGAAPYTSHDFVAALEARFSRVEILGELSPTRRLFLASRRPIPDLSWEAPLPFPKAQVISARMLWALDGIEFHSRVFREGPHKYKQCTPTLGEREMRGLEALGIPAEVVERNEQFWLLRMPYIEGQTLDELAARGPVPRARILDIVRNLILQVAQLRRAGVVHRDLHPANVIVAADGSTHLIDFSWAIAPNVPEVTPPCLAMDVEEPATRTRIRVRPPEASGDDLFAIGRIVAWLDQSSDPELGLLAGWLGHPDYRVRLRSDALALDLVERLRHSEEDAAADGAHPRPLESALVRLAACTLRNAAEAERGKPQREAAARAAAKLTDELARARDEVAKLAQRLEEGAREIQAVSGDRDALRARLEQLSAERERGLAHVQRLDEEIYWMKRSRFWWLRERWFALKGLIRRTA
jgi:hypothetical protein